MRVIILTGLLALSTLAVLPEVAAVPGYECADQNATGKVIDDGTLQVNLRRDCSLEIVLFEGIICVGGWGGVIEQDIGDHTVRAYYCTGRDIPLDDIEIATNAAAPGCPPKTYAFDTGTTHRVEIHHNCRADVTLNEGVICLGGSVRKTEVDLNAVTVTAYGCGSPDPTFPPEIATTSSAAECPPWHAETVFGGVALRRDCTLSVGGTTVPDCTKAQQDKTHGGLRVQVTPDCQAILSAKLYDCIYGGHWEEDTYGPVTVRQYQCDPGYPPAAANSAAAGPCSDGVHHAPATTIYTSDECHTRVDIKLYDCVWNCGWATIVDTDVLTVRHYTQNPAGQSSAAPEIPPLPDVCPIFETPAPADQVIHVEIDKNPCFDTYVTGGEAWTCTGVLGGSTYLEVDRVTVDLPGCGVQAATDPPTTAAASDAQLPPPGCPYVDEPQELSAVVDVRSVPYTCEYHVELAPGLVACTHPLDGGTEVDAGSVSVGSSCGLSPSPQPTADAAPACNGIWYKTGSQTLPTGTTLSYETDGTTECTTVGVQHSAVDCTFDLAPSCEPIYDCVIDFMCGGMAASAAAADPLAPPSSCGIVVHQYEIGPVTVTESTPCYGVAVDPFGDFCVQDDWQGASAGGAGVAVNACTPHMPPPGASTSGPEYLPVCWGPRTYQEVGPYTVDWRHGMSCGSIEEDPDHEEEIDPWDCLGGGSGYTEKKVLWFRIHIDHCTPPPGSLPELA